MGFSVIPPKVNRLVAEHSSAILTAVGMTGTITTAILAARASFSAASRISEYEKMAGTELNLSEKAKIVWPLYIPAVGAGVTTVTSIFFAHQIATKKTAALAAPYGLSEKAFSEYKDKITEKFGENKEEKVRDELAQDRVNKNPVEGQPVLIVGNGDILCYDAPTGRYFQSTMESIKKAENAVNYEIIHHMYASLSLFYDELGLPATSYSDRVGWNTNNIMELDYTSTISSDGRPCLVIDFKVAPITDYGKLY